MSTKKCVTVAAGISDDPTFIHVCFIGEYLADALPNFYFRNIPKRSLEWKPWLREICAQYNWDHVKSPLIWREIGITHTNVSYIGGASQFWELLHKYYDITSNLTKEDLKMLQLDVLFAREITQKDIPCEIVAKRHIMVIGAGRSLCPDLIPQLIMTKELWLSHGVLVTLYDNPGCFFKLKKIVKDMEAIGGGLHAARALDSIPDGLMNCDILIYVDAVPRDEYDTTCKWLHQNYKCIKKLSKQIDQYAPSHMKVIFCSMGPTCFYANVMRKLVKKLSETNIVAVSAHYGLEIMYTLISSLGFDLRNFGCPPVWGYLGINQFIDVCHMIQKYDIYRPNKRAVISNTKSALPLGTKHPELRWFFYMAHDQHPHEHYLRRKAILQYQIGRTEHFQNCRAICDLLRLWYSNKDDVGDDVISLGISSDGTFGIPKGLFFSQPACLKILDDNSRIWVPFGNFPMPNMPLSFFQNLVNTASIITEKIIHSNCETISTNDSKENIVDI